MTLHQFGTFEAKNKLSHLLDLVEQGDEVIITRNGKPVARLAAPETEDQRITRGKEAASNLKRIRASLPKDALKGLSIREMIEEGRS